VGYCTIIDGRKRCVSCDTWKDVAEFHSYAYTTKQGKPSRRLQSSCKPCVSARRKAERAADGGRHLELCRAWKERNRERIRAYNRRRQLDPKVRELKAFHQRLRKARMRSGEGDTPEIRAIYAEALALEKVIAVCPVFDLPELGKKLHVDHIVPLAKGGRHEASNLQILPIGLNMRKGVSCPG